jgi:hypothetical protein
MSKPPQSAALISRNGLRLDMEYMYAVSSIVWAFWKEVTIDIL